MPLFRLGTRGSPLALIQAAMVRAALCAQHDWRGDAIEIVPIRTSGDRFQDRPLAEIGGKALWTKELDRALLEGEIDFAVHSMKDVETLRPPGIAIAAILPRADVRDALIGAHSIATLPLTARVGTSSPRRAAQLRKLRPDIEIRPFRGNVETRLARLAAGEADATLLAMAGLDRLHHHELGTPIPIEEMLPAPAQGAVGVEARADDAVTLALLAVIDDRATRRCVTAERGLLAAIGASCHSPVGALATLDGDRLTLRGELLSESGSGHVTGTASGPDAAAALARDLLDRAPPAVRALFVP